MADEPVTLAPQVVQYDTVTGVPSEFNQYLPKDCEEYKRWAALYARCLRRRSLTRVGLEQTLLYQQVYTISLMLCSLQASVCLVAMQHWWAVHNHCSPFSPLILRALRQTACARSRP
jgi:hypothetical protein